MPNFRKPFRCHFRNRLQWAIVLCGLALLTCGLACSVAQRGVVVVRLHETEKSRIAETVYPGQYNLYAADSPTPKLHYYLKAGEQIGFDRKDENVVAIAGTHRDVIPEGEYVWKRER